MSKMPTINPLFFNKWLYIDNKFFIEKCVNSRHFFIDEKDLQKLGLAGELMPVYSYYMIINSFQSQFLVLQLVQ